MAKKSMKIGPFTVSHQAWAEWHNTRYKAIEDENSPEHAEFLEKLENMNPSMFYNTSEVGPVNMNFIELVTKCQSAKENDIRTVDQRSMKVRGEKISLADNTYLHVPVTRVVGRTKPQLETFHFHKAMYVGIVDGVVSVDEGVTGVIPTHFIVVMSRFTKTPEELVQALKKHDNKDDIVTDAQVTKMKLGQMSLSHYGEHKLVKNGTSAVKKWGVKNPAEAFAHPIVGPLYRAYLDNTVDNGHNFSTMTRAIDTLVERQRVFEIGVGYSQAGFARGVIQRLSMAVIEEVLTVEEAVNLLSVKMNAVSSLTTQERSYLENAARIMYNIETDGYDDVLPNRVDAHHDLGSRFIASAIREI